MKKLLILFIGFSFALTSCSSDDNGGNTINASIVGTWTLKKLNSDSDFGFATATGQGKDYDATLTFNDQPNQVFGSGSVVLELTTYVNGIALSTDEQLISFENQFETGQWELSDNKLTLSGQASEVSVTVTKLTSNSLIFRYDTDGTTIITYEFTR